MIARPAVWFGDGDTDEKTAGFAGGGRIENAKIFTGSDQNGHN